MLRGVAVQAFDSSQLPHDVAEAASEAAMLALDVSAPAQVIRTDLDPPHIFFLKADPASTLANWVDAGPIGSTGANPTATVGVAAVNGVAATFMRSDAAPAIDQGIEPTWTAKHTFNIGAAGGAAYTPAAAKDFATKDYVDAGVASASPVVATGGAIAQAANVNTPALYAVEASGLFRVSAFVVVSQAATTSSVMPGCSVSYTEATTNTAVQDIVTTTANTNLVGLHTGGSIVIQAREGTNIGFSTSNYASVGATPMQYTVNVKVEALG